MTERFRFRPAPLRPAQDWLIDGALIEGPSGAILLHEITGLRISETRVQATLLRSVQLWHSGGHTRISVNLPRRAGPGHPDYDAYSALLTRIADRVARYNPEMQVEIGESRGVLLAFFLIGLVSLLFGLGIAGLAMVTGLSGDRMAAAAVPMLAMIALGLVVMQSNIPWRSPLRLPVTHLPAMLAALDRREP